MHENVRTIYLFSIVAGVLLGSAGGCGDSAWGNAEAPLATITVVNNSPDEDIISLYVHAGDAQSWGEDLLGDRILKPGQRISFLVQAGYVGVKYVYQGETSDGWQAEEGVLVQAGETEVFTYR